MTRILFTISFLIIVFSGFSQLRPTDPSEWAMCRKLDLLLNAERTIPNFKLDLSVGKNSLNKKLLNTFGQEFIENNPSIEMRIPQTVLQRNIFLKVRVSHGMYKPDSTVTNCFDRPNFLKIMINSKDEFLINGEFSHVDSVQRIVGNYFTQIGTRNESPETFEKSKILIELSDYTTQKCLDQTLKKLCYGYLDFVNSMSSKSICRTSRKEIEELRKKFSLNIILVTGKNPPLEEIIIIEDNKPIQSRTE